MVNTVREELGNFSILRSCMLASLTFHNQIGGVVVWLGLVRVARVNLVLPTCMYTCIMQGYV